MLLIETICVKMIRVCLFFNQNGQRAPRLAGN